MAHPRHVREGSLGGLVDRGQVVEVQHVGRARARRGELALPGRDEPLVGVVVHAGEHAVGRARPVLVGGLEGGIGRERVGSRGGGRVVERADLQPAVEGLGVRLVARPAERAARDRDLPAGARQEAREVAGHLRGAPAREEQQAHHRPGGQRIVGTEPPSTDQAAPTTFDARSEQRNTIAAATSSSVPMRPRGRLERVALEHLVPALARARGELVGEAALARPRLPLDRAGRDGVHQHRAAGPGVGEHPAERELRGLGDRVGRVEPGRGPLAGRRRHVHDPPSPGLGHGRRERAHQPHRRPSRAAPTAPASRRRSARRAGARGSVPAAFTSAQGAEGQAASTRSPASRRRHVQVQVGAPARHGKHAGALLRQHSGRRGADAPGGAGDHADLAFETEVHER